MWRSAWLEERVSKEGTRIKKRAERKEHCVLSHHLIHFPTIGRHRLAGPCLMVAPWFPPGRGSHRHCPRCWQARREDSGAAQEPTH